MGNNNSNQSPPGLNVSHADNLNHQPYDRSNTNTNQSRNSTSSNSTANNNNNNTSNNHETSNTSTSSYSKHFGANGFSKRVLAAKRFFEKAPKWAFSSSTSNNDRSSSRGNLDRSGVGSERNSSGFGIR